MILSKENEQFIYNFIKNDLSFYPSIDDKLFLPFSMNRPFAVYDISSMTDEQIDLLNELAPEAFLNCLPNGHQLYAVDWFHDYILYDPRNPSTAQSKFEHTPSYNSKGSAYFYGFYPDGDYFFFIEKYGRFGYLSHPWRDEVWVYGTDLLSEFEKIHRQIGFVLKAKIT